MKLSLAREMLLPALQMISGVVEKRHTMPILGNFLLKAEDGRLTITGTNMEVEMVASIGGIPVSEGFRTTVPARKLVDIFRALAEDSMVEIELKENRLDLRSGKSHFTLATLPAEHFPAIEPEEDSIVLTVPQKSLKKTIDSVAFGMAQQDVRYYLNGMLFELSSFGMKAVATDGHRLALSGLEAQTGLTDVKSIILPRKGVLELAKLLQDTESPCVLTIGKNHLKATVDSFTFTSKLIDGKFPDYQRVIPKGGDKKVIADRNDLKDVLIRASILSHESIRGIRLFLEESVLTVSANNPDQEKAEDSLTVEYSGEPLQIGFNVSYLLDVMNVIKEDRVQLTLSTSSSSALVEGEHSRDALYVVMPMRL
jgi:DNA polymerase-3 subunit beta